MRSDRRQAGIAALGVLAVLLPFELKRPLFTVGPLAITDLELVLYGGLAVWFVGRVGIGTRGLAWTGAHTAVAAWAAALAISAACAPAARADCVKFALRGLGGCALFFAAADLVRAPAQAATVLLAVAFGGVVSAAAGLAEVVLSDGAALLLAFKTQPTLVGSFLRAGGTFQYANTAAMYWEAALPIAVGLGGWRAARRPFRQWRIAAVFSTSILAAAIVLSASRAALLVTAAALAGLLLLGFGRVRALRVPAAVGLTSLAALAILALSTNPWMALRFHSETSATWYRTAYVVAPSPLDMTAGEPTTVSVTARNDGLLPWRAGGEQPVRLSYHWRDPADGRTVVFDGRRTALPADVAPGERVTLQAVVLAPPRPGLYTLRWDMVQEGSLWFSAQGAPTGDVPVRVRPVPLGATPSSAAGSDAVVPAMVTRASRAELWRAGWRMWRERPLLGGGPDSFRHRYGPYLGLGEFDDRIHSNSLYVETLATTGLAGALALLGLIVALGRAGRRAWRVAADPGARSLVAGLVAGLAAFFLHGLVDYFFEFTPTYGLFWLLAGATAGLASSAERAR